MNASLAVRLAALKAEANTSIKSELEAVPTPLWVVLCIFTKAEKECSINYMQGLKALEYWLTTEQEAIALSNLIPIVLPKHFITYELNRVVEIISRYERNLQKAGLDKALSINKEYRCSIAAELIAGRWYK